MKLGFAKRRAKLSPNREGGYLLLTLVLLFTLILLALAASLPAIKQQLVRDREDELRHRGTAYMRAIQHYYKKLGRYPTRLEDLENTNNIRYLRKRYTDPTNVDAATGKEKDFKLLHYSDLSLLGAAALGQIPGTQGIAGPNGQPLAGTQGIPSGGINGAQAQSLLAGLAAQSGGIQQTGQQNLNGDSGGTGASGDASTGSSSPGATGGSASGSGSPFGSASGSGSASGLGGQTFGGGPILGVASSNKKDKSVHVFYSKNHYNDWLFIYLPTADRGGLLTGPVNPGAPAGNLTPGAGGGPGQGGLGQGAGQGFGGQSGFGSGQSGLGSGFGQQGPGQGSSLNGGQNQNPQGQNPPN